MQKYENQAGKIIWYITYQTPVSYFEKTGNRHTFIIEQNLYDLSKKASPNHDSLVMLLPYK